MEDRWAGMIQAGLVGVGEHLPAAFVDALCGHRGRCAANQLVGTEMGVSRRFEEDKSERRRWGRGESFLKAAPRLSPKRFSLGKLEGSITVLSGSATNPPAPIRPAH